MVSVAEGNERRFWCLVSSRYWMLGMRRRVLKQSETGWSVPAELRAGDMVVMYERGRPAGPRGLRGRKLFPILARADTDARPDDEWGYWADFTAIPIQPGIPWKMVKDDPVASRWPAVRARMQGKRGNHEVPRHVWDAIVRLADRVDPGAAADAAALMAGEPAPPRGESRAHLVDEDLAIFESERFENEQVIETLFFELIADAARPATPADGVPPKGGNGHAIPGYPSYCDALIVALDQMVVVEFECEATGDPAHGVMQAVRYRGELASAGIEASACVVAQSFADIELVLAKEHGVECFRIAIRQDEDVFELVNMDTENGPLSAALVDAVVDAALTGEFNVYEPDVAADYGLDCIDGEVVTDIYMQTLGLLCIGGTDIRPLRGEMDADSFEEEYVTPVAMRIVEDFGLPTSISREQLDALNEAIDRFFEGDMPVAPPVAGREWSNDGAPYCLRYPEVAVRFGISLDWQGTPPPSIYFQTLLMIQDEGYDLTPMLERLSEERFWANYVDWMDRLVADFDLPQRADLDV